MHVTFKKALLPSLISSLVLLSACGGSSDPSDDTANKTLTTGVITGFGSIYVNGCKYDTENASIDADDVTANGQAGQSNLDVGMVVTVSGSSTTDANGTCTGSADKIIFDNDVEGPIASDSLNITASDPVSGSPSALSVVIFGITVIMDLDTVFKSESGAPYDIGSVAEGDVLEVSGLMDDNGQLIATYVELQDEKDYSIQKYELKGMIADLDTAAMTFTINGMPVRYDGNTEYDDLSPTDLSNGLFVEVKGMLDDTGASLMATKIEAEDNGWEEGQDYHSELEGVISNYDPESMTFTLQGVMVDASSTALELEPAGLVLGDGLRVEVEGDLQINDDGSYTLRAYEIKQKGRKIEIQATIVSIDDSREQDPSADLVTLSVFGKTLTVRVNQQTRIEAEYGAGNTYAVGDHVDVEAFADGSGVINAVELEVDHEDDVELKGPVDGYDMTAMTITLFGTTFDISQATLEVEHALPPAADFWASIDGQGYVELVDKYPADGIIDKVEVDHD